MINRIYHPCSCIIEFIKRVGERRDKMPSILSLFPNSFYKFTKTWVIMLNPLFTPIQYVPLSHRLAHNIRIHHVWDRKTCPEDHHLASRGLPRIKNSDPDGQIFPSLIQIIDSFSCSPQTFNFKISFQKSLNTLSCNIKGCRHFDKIWRQLTTMCVRSNTTNQATPHGSMCKITWVK